MYFGLFFLGVNAPLGPCSSRPLSFLQALPMDLRLRRSRRQLDQAGWPRIHRRRAEHQRLKGLSILLLLVAPGRSCEELTSH